MGNHSRTHSQKTSTLSNVRSSLLAYALVHIREPGPVGLVRVCALRTLPPHHRLRMFEHRPFSMPQPEWRVMFASSALILIGSHTCVCVYTYDVRYDRNHGDVVDAVQCDAFRGPGE